jgi:hypothetical protein
VAFNGEFPAGTKIVIDNKILEHISYVSYLGSEALYPQDECLRHNLNGCGTICGTMGRNLKAETGKGRYLIFLKSYHYEICCADVNLG